MFYVQTSMKHLAFFTLVFVGLFSLSQAQFTTEGFESFTEGNTGFTTNNCQPFTLTGNFAITRWAGFGYGPSDQYLDNVNSCLSAAGVVGAITTADVATFNVTSLWLFPSEDCNVLGTGGDAIIRGKFDGSTEFTQTIAQGSWNTQQGTNNGFTFVDLSAHQNIEIDELEFEVTGNVRYLAIDDVRWRTTATADPASSSVISASGMHPSTISTTDGDGWTHFVNGNDELMLSLQLGSSGAVIPCGGVSVQIGATAATHYASGTGFITNPQGAVFINRSWDVQPTTQPTGNVGVRFYFTAAEYAAVNAELANQGMATLSAASDMQFYKATAGGAHAAIASLSTSNVIQLTNGGTSTTEWTLGNAGADYYAEFQVSDFSGGGGGSAGSGDTFFPVEFLSFSGLRKQEQVALEWRTAREQNSAYFQVERSLEGTGFEAIGEVAAAGFSQEVRSYRFLDEHPCPGGCFYRLKQVDLDGAYMYSSVIELAADEAQRLRIGPNPFRDRLYVHLPSQPGSSGRYRFLLYAPDGQVVMEQHWQPASASTQDLSLALPPSLPNGMYVYSLTDGQQVYRGKLVRMR